MAEVRSIAKKDRNQQQGFAFRGIDAVLDEVGPALRNHGVHIVPCAKDIRSESYATKNGTSMRNVTVTVEYTVFGPAGDSFTGTTIGEAADSGDKAVTKAQSVAYRTFLLQALTMPTGDPDPDASTHERAAHSPADKARHELAALCKSRGLNTGEVAQRFADDYGADIRKAGADTIRAFTALIADEGSADAGA